MKHRILAKAAAVFLLTATLHGAETFDAAMRRAATDYAGRLEKANEELTQTRERIAGEKAPLLEGMRVAEDRNVAAEAEFTRLDTAQAQSQEKRRMLVRDAEALRKNLGYADALAQESLTAFGDGLAPGEGRQMRERIEALRQKIDAPSAAPDGLASVDVAGLLLEHVEQSLGGYAEAGSALMGEGNRIVPGVFAFAGPEVFFRSDQDGAAGTVRAREGSPYPTAYALKDWKLEDSAAFFQGRTAEIPVDGSDGKALKLEETKGTVWQHIQKGGVVAYAILVVGLLAGFMILQKIGDLSKMAVDTPETVDAFLAIVASGRLAEAGQAVAVLKGPTRELFAQGLRHIAKPKEILEEYLNAVLLRQRLHYERRLPLLAVIATAAPLMGLLGTVTGMVRTFALITVFGTGNAGKLASGISEVLVATELGLLVAIPTLVAHGFLAQRIQKNLSLLERYALEFVTAAQSDRAENRPNQPAPAC
jgi:biopolymer transport protein ExbB